MSWAEEMGYDAYDEEDIEKIFKRNRTASKLEFDVIDDKRGAAMPDEKYQSFKEAAEPLIKWLNENANPHAVVVVEPDNAVLYSGEISHPTNEFIKD